MNQLQIFNNPEFGALRTFIEPDGTVLFCGNDVASILGYARPRDAIQTHCKGAVKRRLLTQAGEQQANFVQVGDIYRLAARSQLPDAERFESWIFDKVIPSIHKTGSYSMQPTSPAQLALQQAQIMVDMEARINTMESLVLDVSAKAEQAIAKAESAIKVYAVPDKDHWTEDMTAAIIDLARATGWSEPKLRGSLYAELETTVGHTNINTRQKRLCERMKKTGMTYRDAHALTKLDAIAAEHKLRVIFESIVRKRQAQYA